MSNRSSQLAQRFQSLPSALAVASGSGKLLALAALLALLALTLLPNAGQAQTPTAPTIDSVSVASVPASGDTYGRGETIEVAVVFTAAVTVTGTPQIHAARRRRRCRQPEAGELRRRQRDHDAPLPLHRANGGHGYQRDLPGGRRTDPQQRRHPEQRGNGRHAHLPHPGPAGRPQGGRVHRGFHPARPRKRHGPGGRRHHRSRLRRAVRLSFPRGSPRRCVSA